MLENNKYSFAFTTMAAQIPETISVAQLYCNLQDWKLVEKAVISENIINKSKNVTNLKIFSEIKKRINNLDINQLELFESVSFEEQKFLILISIVKTYRIIFDFIVEVLVPKIDSYDYFILDSDYQYFIEAKIELIPELQRLSKLSQNKIKQRIFTILNQIGIIDNLKNKRIQKILISATTADSIKKDTPILLKLCNL